MFKSSQLINCELSFVGSNELFLVSIVYGFNTLSERKQLWDDIITIASSVNTKWCILRDFNEICSLDETHGGMSGHLVWMISKPILKGLALMILEQLALISHGGILKEVEPFHESWMVL